ncbi:MAG TPA: molybdenum cofactor guanylyltransferase [Marinilabiliaceae bacterium]|nr:molybdenum cofactor guanylyltransferase [Marinilabiliaceae bacterium]
MSLNNSDITGVVLAGGQSRRMGFNKAEAEMHGKSMLIRMINKLKEVTPAILVSSGTITYPNIPWPQIPDEQPQCGPLGGIYSVLNVSTTSLNLVVSCDMPLVSISLLKHIVARATISGSLITIPVDHNGQLQTTCAVYHKNILPFLENQINTHAYKMKELLDLVSVEYVVMSIEHPLYQEHAFMNVNTPSSLQEARKTWNSHQE